MAKVDDYLYEQECCLCHAWLSTDHENKRAWMDLAESFTLLLLIDKIEGYGALIGRYDLDGPYVRSVATKRSNNNSAS